MKASNYKKSNRHLNLTRSVRCAFKSFCYGGVVTTAAVVLCISFTTSSIGSSQDSSASKKPTDAPLFAIKLQDRLLYPLKEPVSFENPQLMLSGPVSSEPKKSEPTGHKGLTPPLQLKKKAHLFHPIILKAADRHDVDPALVKAIIMAESGYNPKAISRRGAAGLMQLMPKTAKSLGVKDIFDPEHNIDGGVRYFKRLVTKYDGNVRLALAAYNAGSRKVNLYQGVPPFKSTRFYIKKVLTYYKYFKHWMAVNTESA